MRLKITLMVLSLVLLSCASVINTVAEDTRATPPAPNSVSAEPMNNKISISWDYPNGYDGNTLVGFTLRRGLSSGSVDTVVANDLGPFVLFYVDSSLNNGMTYFYTVTAINDDGAGVASEPVSATPRGPSSKPTNFSATYGSNFVRLTWDAPEDPNGSPVSGYILYKGLFENNITIRNDVDMDMEFMDQGLINGKTYYYQVLAVTDYGEGSRSVKLAVAPRTTPSAPFNITLTPGDDQVHISWNRSLDDGGVFIENYWIFRGYGMDNLTKVGHTPSPMEITYTDDTVENGVTYYYQVAGYNSEGVGDRSPIYSVVPLGPPGKPLNLTLKPGDTNVTLEWKTPEFDGGTDITGYNIYMRTYDENEMTLEAEIDVQVSYTMDGLMNGEIHYFQVKAVNEIGEGPGSNTELIRPEPLPKTPESFDVQDLEGRVKLVWSKPSYTGEYDYEKVNIYRGTSEDSLELYDHTTMEFSYYFDEDVEIGTVYYYEVSITSLIGEGLRTPTLIGRPFGRPSVPNDFQVQMASTRATLTWTHPDKNGGRVIDGFNIFRGTNPDTITQLQKVSGNVLIYNDTGLINGRTYYYRISAYNKELEGNSTELISITPIGPPGNPREPMAILDAVNKTITITWEDPSNNGGVDIVSYKLYRGTESNNLTFHKEVQPGEILMDDDIEDGVEYFYKITAVNPEGEGGASYEFSILIPQKETENEEEGGGFLIWIIIGLVIAILMALLIGVAVFQFQKKKKDEEKEEAPELEESEAEREERLILERRKMMGEYTDVALDTTMAHVGDHEQHDLSYEDLYGSPDQHEKDHERLYGDEQPLDQTQVPGQEEVTSGPVEPQMNDVQQQQRIEPVPQVGNEVNPTTEQGPAQEKPEI